MYKKKKMKKTHISFDFTQVNLLLWAPIENCCGIKVSFLLRFLPAKVIYYYFHNNLHDTSQANFIFRIHKLATYIEVLFVFEANGRILLR